MNRCFLLLLTLAFGLSAAAQSDVPDGFRPPTLEQLKQKDLAALWIGALPLLEREDSAPLEWVDRPEPLGYIGRDYKRFYIHFTNIRRSPDDSLRYELQGFTRVGGNICRATGELQIDSLYAVESQEDMSPVFWGGIGSGWQISGHYTLREDPGRSGSGILAGRFAMDIAADAAGTIYYDTMTLVYDGYCNNLWEGTWTSYTTKTVKPCNWGDFRIPESGMLDIGSGEFSPADEYLSAGWQTYRDAWSNRNKAAMKEEARRWWWGE